MIFNKTVPKSLRKYEVYETNFSKFYLKKMYSIMLNKIEMLYESLLTHFQTSK